MCTYVCVCVFPEKPFYFTQTLFNTCFTAACIFKVMLTKNLDVARGLVNGARGVVVDFESGKHGPYLAVKNPTEAMARQDCILV